LWWDGRDIPFLREDRKDAAEIQQIKAATIGQYVRDGFLPDSAIKATEAENPTLLKHSGLFSVQLQEAGSQEPAPTTEPTNGTVPAEAGVPNEA